MSSELIVVRIKRPVLNVVVLSIVVLNVTNSWLRPYTVLRIAILNSLLYQIKSAAHGLGDFKSFTFQLVHSREFVSVTGERDVLDCTYCSAVYNLKMSGELERRCVLIRQGVVVMRTTKSERYLARDMENQSRKSVLLIGS